MDANRMLLIVNPRAGTMQSQRSLFKIGRILRRRL